MQEQTFSILVNGELIFIEVQVLTDNFSEEPIDKTEVESCAKLIVQKLYNCKPVNTILIQGLSNTISLAVLLASWYLGSRVAVAGENIGATQLQIIREQLGDHIFICCAQDTTDFNIEINAKQHEFISWLHSQSKNTPVKIGHKNWQENEPAVILFTSGSTGNPKGVYHSLPSLIRSARLFVSHFKLTSSDRVVCFAETHTMSGFRSLLFAFISKMTVFFIRENWSKTIDKLQYLQPTIIICGPSLLTFLINFKSSIPTFLPDNTKILCTGSYLDKKIVSEIYSRWQIPILNYYGLIETAGIVFADSHMNLGDYLPPPCSGVEYVLLPFDQQKNIFYLGIKSSNLFLGYLNDNIHKPDLFNTGDLVSIHEDETLTLVGRASEMIKGKNTEWIYPSLLENWLKKRNEIIDVVVQGHQSNYLLLVWIETNKDIIFLNNKFLPLISDELGVNYCSIVWRRSKIQRSALGKVEKKIILGNQNA